LTLKAAEDILEVEIEIHFQNQGVGFSILNLATGGQEALPFLQTSRQSMPR
jgi:hypothetical protein